MLVLFVLAVSGTLPRHRLRRLSSGAYDPRNWMKNMKDDAKIGHLAIPGTHNSGAYSTKHDVSECQDWNVKDQLENGIRFLDIRLGDTTKSSFDHIRFLNRHVPELFGPGRAELTDFEIRHGLFHLGSFNDLVMEPVVDFLSSYPTETILMSIRGEDTLDVDRLERDFIRNSAYRFYQDTISPSTELGTIRGKIVLFKRYSRGANIGISWGSSYLKIQDNYKLGVECKEIGFSWMSQRVCASFIGLDYPKKSRQVVAHLDDARDDFGGNCFWVNFASANWKGLYIGNSAKVVNRAAREFFNRGFKAIGTIIPMDYPNRETGLIASIIKNNMHRNLRSVLQSAQTDGFWGNWGDMVKCPPRQFVYGYRLRSEAPITGDDTALNDIELHCAAKGHSGSYTKIYSAYHSAGDFSSFKYCAGDNPVVGFDMRIEPKQGGGDDTAANDVDLYCKLGGFISADVSTSWGDWTPALRCPCGHAVMGITTRVEDSQDGGDDSALNGVRMLCAEY